MSFTTVTLAGKYLCGDGTAGQGTVQVQLTQPMENSNVIVETTPVPVILDSTGAFSMPLKANDDPGTLPLGTQYIVIERVTATSNREYQITIPHAAPGGTIDISTLMPSAPPGIG